MALSSLQSLLESLLLAAVKPVTAEQFLAWSGADAEELKLALGELQQSYQKENRGWRLVQNGDEYQLVTNPEFGPVLREFLQEERASDLTPASLETLALVAYRGPISQAELETLRGSTCTVILKNLTMKGLVETADHNALGEALYRVSLEFLNYLGVEDIKDLPDFERLSQHEYLLQSLAEKYSGASAAVAEAEK